MAARAKKYVLRLGNFWISLVGLASAVILFWHFEALEDLYAQVVLTGAFVIMSLAGLQSGLSTDPRDKGITFVFVWPALLPTFLLAITAAAEAGLVAVVLNLASILASLPFLWLLWRVVEERWLLLLPTAIATMLAASLYLIPPLTSDGLTLVYLPAALPLLSFVSIPWAIMGNFALNRAARYRKRPVRGPATESLSMLWLFSPLVALSMLAVNTLGADDIWVAMSGVIVSLIFGSTVSNPVRQLVLDLGNLSSPDSSF